MIGNSQNFFRSRMNAQSSERNDAMVIPFVCLANGTRSDQELRHKWIERKQTGDRRSRTRDHPDEHQPQEAGSHQGFTASSTTNISSHTFQKYRRQRFWK